MVIAVIVTLLSPEISSATRPYMIIAVAVIIGAAIGITVAIKIKMTAMPQLVAMLHSFVGLAAVLVAIGTFTIPWLGNFGILLGIFVVIGIFESMAIPSLNAIAVEKGRVLGMGTVMGTINMAMSLGLITGSLVGGVIQTSMGIDAVFRFAATLGLVGILLFNILIWRSVRLSRDNLAIIKPGVSTSHHDEPTDA